jgi:hypothetical protein
MFKLAIKSNVLGAMVKPTNLNLFTQLWHIPLIIKVFFNFLGSMEDVHCFKKIGVQKIQVMQSTH